MSATSPKITLYSLAVSHPARMARLELDYEGLDYKRIDLPNGPHAVFLRAMVFLRAIGFPAGRLRAQVRARLRSPQASGSTRRMARPFTSARSGVGLRP